MRVFRRLAVAVAVLIWIAASAGTANARVNAGVTLPVMTPLTVKLDEAVNAKTAVNGSGFTATVKDPVEVDGTTVIPVNASAGGLVSKESQSSGELVLNSVFVSGRMYRITTSPISFHERTNLRAGATLTFRLVFSLKLAR